MGIAFIASRALAIFAAAMSCGCYSRYQAGTVTGQFLIGGKPAAGRSVSVSSVVDPPRVSVIGFRDLATTDVDGRFRIDGVPPGRVDVSEFVKSDGTPGDRTYVGEWQRSQEIELKPQEIREVTVGETGRAIDGTLALPEGFDGLGFSREAYVYHRETLPGWPMPEAIVNGSAEERRAWVEAFKTTNSYRALLEARKKVAAAFRNYTLEWPAPAAFHLDDLAAGDYELNVAYRDRAGTLAYTSGDVKFTIPPMPGGKSDEPLRLPPVNIRAVVTLAVGKPVPDWVLRSLDGKTIRVSDYRGKFLVIDSWATTCGPCLAAMPELEKTFLEFASSGKLAMLGINFDATIDKAATFVNARHLAWDHAWAGGDGGPVEDMGFGSIWLVGPDGVVIAGELSGDGIRAAVAKAMERQFFRGD